MDQNFITLLDPGSTIRWSHTTKGCLRVLHAKGVAITHREQQACKTALASVCYIDHFT